MNIILRRKAAFASFIYSTSNAKRGKATTVNWVPDKLIDCPSQSL